MCRCARCAGVPNVQVWGSRAHSLGTASPTSEHWYAVILEKSLVVSLIELMHSCVRRSSKSSIPSYNGAFYEHRVGDRVRRPSIDGKGLPG